MSRVPRYRPPERRDGEDLVSYLRRQGEARDAWWSETQRELERMDRRNAILGVIALSLFVVATWFAAVAGATSGSGP